MAKDLKKDFKGKAKSEPKGKAEAEGDSPRDMIIPNVVRDNDKGGRVIQDIFSRMLDSNIIFVTGQVEPGMATIITAELLHLYYDKIKNKIDNAGGDMNAVPEEDRTLKMFINSPGGIVNDGLMIYDCMQLLKSEGVIIETHATGIAMSMGSILLVAGSEGHRYAWPSANIMLHQLSGGAQGTATDMDVSNEESQYLNERLKDVYRAHTKLTDEHIEKIFTNNYFIRAEEAEILGLIDHVNYPENDPRVTKMLKKQNHRHMEGEETVKKVKKMRVLRDDSSTQKPPSNDM